MDNSLFRGRLIKVSAFGKQVATDMNASFFDRSLQNVRTFTALTAVGGAAATVAATEVAIAVAMEATVLTVVAEGAFHAVLEKVCTDMIYYRGRGRGF